MRYFIKQSKSHPLKYTMTCLVLVCSMIASLAFVFGSNILDAATIKELASIEAIDKMSAIEFDRVIQAAREEAKRTKEQPELIAKVIAHRLMSGLSVFDQTLITAVNSLTEYGFLVAEEKHDNSHQRSIEFINEVISLMDKNQDPRRFLRAKLYQKKAYLHRVNGETSKSISANKEALRILIALAVDVDRDRISTQLELAQQLYSVNDKKNAEELYLEILSYPWFNLNEYPEDLQIFKQFYIQAGIGLIDCRRGDLEGLKNIFFYPATEDILGPILEKAIDEANGR